MATLAPTMRSLVTTWVALLVMTAITVAIGGWSTHVSGFVVVGVLALAAIKVYLVGSVFMEMTAGSPLLRGLLVGYVGLLFVGLSALTLW